MRDVIEALEYAAYAAVVAGISVGLYTTGLGAYMVKAFGILLGHAIG